MTRCIASICRCIALCTRRHWWIRERLSSRQLDLQTWKWTLYTKFIQCQTRCCLLWFKKCVFNLSNVLSLLLCCCFSFSMFVEVSESDHSLPLIDGGVHLIALKALRTPSRLIPWPVPTSSPVLENPSSLQDFAGVFLAWFQLFNISTEIEPWDFRGTQCQSLPMSHAPFPDKPGRMRLTKFDMQ